MILCNSRFNKVLSIMAFTFITIVLTIASKIPPSNGYEITMYSNYPLYFWLFLILSIISGIGIILNEALFHRTSKCWIIGLTIILFTNFIIVLLPEFRGYAFYGRGQDTLSHIGLINDILSSGHVGIGNFYPTLHILASYLVLLSHVSIAKISYVFSIIYLYLFTFGIYLLAKTSSKQFGQVLFILMFSSPLLFNYYYVLLSTNFFSILSLPFLLFLYIRRELVLSHKLEYTLLTLITLFFVVYSHPITVILCIFIFLTFGISNILYYGFVDKKKAILERNLIIGKNYRQIVLIAFVSFFMWYSSYSVISNSFKHVADWLMGEIFSPSTYNTQLTLLNSISFTKSQILWLYATRYGSITVLFAISSIFCIFTLHKYVAKRTSLDPLVFCYAIQFVVSMLIGIIMLFGDFIEHNPIRVFRVGILMGTILSGLVTYDVVANLEKSKFAKKAHLDYLSVILLIGIIILMVVLSLFSTYTSPFNYAANSQTTSMDIMGVKWLNSFNSYTDTKVVVAPQSQLTFLRYQDYLSTNFTYGEGMLSNNRYYLDTQALPSHFGYGGNISIFDSLHRFDKYVLIFQIDRLLYHVYPTNTLNDIAYWSAEDFKLLESDSSANKIYYNGETEVLKV